MEFRPYSLNVVNEVGPSIRACVQVHAREARYYVISKQAATAQHRLFFSKSGKSR